jgi:two-component system CheB/CheR fusion protein
MAEVGCDTFVQYQDHLEVHPEEFPRLFDTLLINVTSFFRDRAAWDFLREEIVGRIITAKNAHEPIRVWSAGCASGEEAYSVAMVLADALGEPAFRDRVKIYATDLDDDALSAGRHAAYDDRGFAELPDGYLERFFDRVGDRYLFRADLRRSVIFGHHDLLQDAPISRLDLLLCRNTLMYFNAEAQAQVLRKFIFALRPGGFLFLGKAETLLARAPEFSPVDLRLRLFTRIGHERSSRRSEGGEGTAADRSLREAFLGAHPVAGIVVDIDGQVVHVNQAARRLLGLARPDARGALNQLELSDRPVELRPLLSEAYATRGPVSRPGVEWRAHRGERAVLDVVVTPLIAQNGSLLGAAVTFNDVTRVRDLHDELERSRHELAAAYDELQSTNEELETTNEELQSTVEELETTNEELQSANEELETTNEELQSTNDQLHALNEELQVRGSELDQVNLYLGSILTGLRWAVVVLDRGLLVTLWNRWAEDLWGLRSSEAVGRALSALDLGLPVEPLLPMVRAALDGTSAYGERQLKGRNRRGHLGLYRVACTPLQARQNVDGVILVIEAVPGDHGSSEGAPEV